MKRKLLFAVAALMCSIGTWAQTDVTSTYLTNPGFEGNYQRFLDINTDRGVEKPVGWSVEWYQNNNDKNGMTFDAASMTQDSKTWNAKDGKSYFARMRWGNATLYLRQTLQNLRPGNYTLSFSATAHSTNNNNLVQVSVAGQTQVIASGSVSNENGNWTDYHIDFTVTSSTPYATIEFKMDRQGDLLKAGIDNFVLSYDGSSYYSAILTAAQSLHDDNEDWAENGLDDFRAAITAATGKETVADKNAAIVSLEEAMATFKEANSVDMTSRITNATFDSNISGWTTTGGDGNAYQWNNSSQTNFNGGFLEKWRNGWNGGYNQKNFDVYQTLSSMPNGEYTIKANILAQMQGSKETLSDSYKDKKHGGPYYIDDAKGVWLYATSGESSSNTWANSFTNTFGDTSGGVLRSATITVSNGSLTIGFKGIGSENGGTSLGTYANWIACDNWTLSYFGFDPTTLKAEITSLKADAAALLDNSDYDNVTGTERTDLSGVANLTYADEKKATLEALISTIEGRIAAFTAAKPAYDAYAEIRGIAVALGVTPGDAPTSAAAAPAATHALNVAVYNVAAAEHDVTDMYTPSWSDMTTSSGQHWSGDTSISYADEWRGDTNPTTRTATIMLPAGSYILMSAGRGSDNTVTTMSANGTTVTFASNGDMGIGINKDGAASFDAADAAGFANKSGAAENSGTGWEWRYIPVTLTAETSITVTQTLTRLSGSAWGSFSDFTILCDDDTYAPIALEVAKAELQAAIDAAPAVRTANIGYNVFQYQQGDINAYSAALEAAQAAHDASDATVASLEEAKAALETAIATYNALSMNTASDQECYNLYLVDGLQKTVTFKDGNANAGGYTIGYTEDAGSPFNQAIHFLSLDGNQYNLYIEDAEGTKHYLCTGSVYNGNDYQIRTTTDEAYALTVEVIASETEGGIYQLRNTAANALIGSNGDTGLYTANAYTKFNINNAEKVTVNVKIKGGKYATRIFPFAPEGQELKYSQIKFYTCSAVNDKELTLSGVSYRELKANVPYILLNTMDNPDYEEELDLEGYGVAKTATYTSGLLTGVYESTAVPDGSYVLQTLDGKQAFYQVDSSDPITAPAYRAYLTVPSAGDVKAFYFGDIETAIQELVDAKLSKGEIYNLAGQRLQKAQKGVNIINGKKILIK